MQSVPNVQLLELMSHFDDTLSFGSTVHKVMYKNELAILVQFSVDRMQPQLFAKLNDSCICNNPHSAVLFFEKREDDAYYILEFMPHLLHDYIKQQQQVSIAHKYHLLYQVATCVYSLHKCGFVHRDVKPSNFLVSNQGVVKIGNFELADKAQELEQEMIGSPLYMAPELFQANVTNWYKCDVYSFAMLAYYVFLTKEAVYSSILECAQQRIQGHVPSIPSTCPMHAKHLIVWSLALDPRARPNMFQLVMYLEPFAPSFALRQGLFKMQHVKQCTNVVFYFG